MFDQKFRLDTSSSAYTILKLCLLAFKAGWQVSCPPRIKNFPIWRASGAPQYSILVTIILYFLVENRAEKFKVGTHTGTIKIRSKISAQRSE